MKFSPSLKNSLHFWIFSALGVLIAISCFTSCQNLRPSKNASTEKRAYYWLLNQQRETGLLGGQEGGDTFSGLYANALAAICFIHQNDLKRAEKIFNFYQLQFPKENTDPPPPPFNGLPQFWNAETGLVYGDSDRWIGDNAWFLIALNYYAHKTGKTTCDSMREQIANWLISLQDADGGVWSGYNKSGPMKSKSTEGNLDCYAALTDYPEPREKIKQWLTTQMWVPEEGRFKMGSTNDQTPMDSVSWSICSLGPDFKSTLPYGERKFLRTYKPAFSHKKVEGFSDFLDKNRIWFEGTGQMTVAYSVAGEKEKARHYLTEMEWAMVESRAFPETVGLPCASNDPPWEGGSEKIFVPSQAWYLFAKWQFNPMDPSFSEGAFRMK